MRELMHDDGAEQTERSRHAHPPVIGMGQPGVLIRKVPDGKGPDDQYREHNPARVHSDLKSHQSEKLHSSGKHRRAGPYSNDAPARAMIYRCFASSLAGDQLRFITEQFRLQFGDPLLNLRLPLPPLDDHLAIAPQEVIDRFHTNADRSGGLVFVQILETEIGRAGALDNSLDYAIDRRVVAAFKIGNFKRHQIGMPRGELRGPHFVIRAGGIGVFPNIGNIQRMLDHAGANLFAEQPIEQILVHRQSALRKNRITELLKLLHNFVIQPRIVMIRPAEHHDADPIFPLQLVQYFSSLFANAGFVIFESFVPRLDGALIFFNRKTQHRIPGLVHLIGEQLAVGEVQQRVHVADAVLGEYIGLLCERGFDSIRAGRHRRAGVGALQIHQAAVQHIHHWKENNVELLSQALEEDEIVDVRDADFRRETRIDGAAARSGAVQLAAGEIGIDDIFRGYAEALQISVEQRRVNVVIQDARDPDPQIGALLHSLDALARRPGPGA